MASRLAGRGTWVIIQSGFRVLGFRESPKTLGRGTWVTHHTFSVCPSHTHNTCILVFCVVTKEMLQSQSLSVISPHHRELANTMLQQFFSGLYHRPMIKGTGEGGGRNISHVRVLHPLTGSPYPAGPFCHLTALETPSTSTYKSCHLGNEGPHQGTRGREGTGLMYTL